MLSLSSKISDLPRVGPANTKYLKKLGLETIQDLLFYLPYRYDDFRLRKKIADLKPDENVSVQGEIMLIQNRRSFKRRLYLTEALIADESESIKVIWFNQPFLTKNLKVGDQVSISGKTSFTQGQIAFISPQYEKIYGGKNYGDNLIHTAGLIPNYHLTDKKKKKQLRYFIKQVLNLRNEIVDWLPKEIIRDFKLLDLKTALKKIHAPQNNNDIEIARRRLAFSELFLRQLKSQLIKKELSAQQASPLIFREKETRAFVASLPFKLTTDQRKAAWEILQDLEKEKPMSRLLEGDVGSGKTVVAALALLNTALNKQRAVLMAPTEILAKQHFASLTKLFKKQKIKLALMTGAKKSSEATQADIIIGTHALIQKNVELENLALAIVDEQHRFGVRQRQKILDFNKKDKLIPHFLSMTATPIPRSLALAIYGDLDLSIIKELPSGRKKIITRLVNEKSRNQAYDFIRQKIKAGRQAFVICPLIEDSDRFEAKSAKAEHEHLQKNIFPDLKIGLLHGKMKSLDKEKAMQEFLNKKTDILVSTSVIEVGVDVPNASLIAIEGAERFGLAQLHQFRGRVGRGEHQSYCLLFPSNATTISEKTKERLTSLEKYHDGFSLAKMDLKLRGAGELYGEMQSGFSELQIASLFDYEIIKKSNEAARALVAKDAKLKTQPLLKEKLGEWEKTIHLE